MPEIALCWNCTACADFTPIERSLVLEAARVAKVERALGPNAIADARFAVSLHEAKTKRKKRKELGY